MGTLLRSCVAILAAALIVGGPALTAAPAARPAHIGQTKKQAELNLLRVAARKWNTKMPQLIDSRTGLLKNNVRSICRGLDGHRHSKVFRHFTCRLRAWPVRGQTEVLVTYRALSRTRFRVRLRPIHTP